MSTLLAQLLLATPPKATKGRRSRAKATAEKNPRCVDANRAKHELAVARYRAVMGDAWVGTRNIERRLGMGPSTIITTLESWEARQLIERRPAFGSEKWNRRTGWEWRFLPVGENALGRDKGQITMREPAPLPLSPSPILSPSIGGDSEEKEGKK